MYIVHKGLKVFSFISDYLSDLVETVLFFILPPNDFANMPLRALLVEILVSLVLLPLINQLTDPDYINSLIVWAVSWSMYCK